MPRTKNRKTIAAAFCLGIATSIRVLGPLAGAIVLGYAGFVVFARHGLKSVAIPTKSAEADSASARHYVRSFVIYILVAIIVTLLTWPYLWENPIGRLFETLKFMSDNPTQLAVLFNGEIFRATVCRAVISRSCSGQRSPSRRGSCSGLAF